jgi:hypothetical protein
MSLSGSPPQIGHFPAGGAEIRFKMQCRCTGLPHSPQNSPSATLWMVLRHVTQSSPINWGSDI